MLDTSEGSSGSPLLKESDHKLQLLGLHIGTYPATQPLFNVGIHIKKILDHFKSNKVSQLGEYSITCIHVFVHSFRNNYYSPFNLM